MGHAKRVRLERCPQLGCFNGDPATGYELTLPLDADGEIDALALSRTPSLWQVRRFETNHDDLTGSIVRDSLGAWMIRYGNGQPARSDGFAPSVRFRPNSLINVVEGKEVWAYRVSAIAPI
jgi:hypothetical protein